MRLLLETYNACSCGKAKFNHFTEDFELRSRGTFLTFFTRTSSKTTQRLMLLVAFSFLPFSPNYASIIFPIVAGYWSNFERVHIFRKTYPSLENKNQIPKKDCYGCRNWIISFDRFINTVGLCETKFWIILRLINQCH
jgi:hypothetical protein